MSRSPITLKIGGRSAEDDALVSTLGGEVAELKDPVAVVHGGGFLVSELQQRYGLTPRFESGVRMTSREEMPLVDMALAGGMNTRLVRLFANGGVNAVGVSGCDGRTLLAESVTPPDNHTGRILRTDPHLIQLLLDNGYTPLISSVSMDGNAEGLNINADDAALALAASLKSSTLIFISDVPGIMGEDQMLISTLDEKSAEAAISSGVISGGMIPKIRASFKALREGVSEVIIGSYGKKSDLDALLLGEGCTRLIR